MSLPPGMQSVHPLVVHFPIALILSAFLVDALALVLKRPHLHRVALWNLCLGTLGASAAVWTGLQAQNVAKHSFEIWEVMELHEKLGITTLILGLMSCGLRLGMRDRLNGRLRAFAMLLALAMVSTLTYGASLGGRLVYEFGVGGAFGAPQTP